MGVAKRRQLGVGVKKVLLVVAELSRQGGLWWWWGLLGRGILVGWEVAGWS